MNGSSSLQIASSGVTDAVAPRSSAPQGQEHWNPARKRPRKETAAALSALQRAARQPFIAFNADPRAAAAGPPAQPAPSLSEYSENCIPSGRSDAGTHPFPPAVAAAVAAAAAAPIVPIATSYPTSCIRDAQVSASQQQSQTPSQPSPVGPLPSLPVSTLEPHLAPPLLPIPTAYRGPQLGQECSATFWTHVPSAWKAFPLQAHALHFADWLNAQPHPEAAAAALDSITARHMFSSYEARWRFMAGWMAENAIFVHPLLQQEGQQQQRQGGAQQQEQRGGDQQQQLQQGYGQELNGRFERQRLPNPFRVVVQEYPRGGGARQWADGLQGAGRGGWGRRRGFAAAGDGDHTRQFVVTTFKTLWRRYPRWKPLQRHFYELIRDTGPCHMYFDLEFVPSANQGADGDKMVDKLLGILGCLIKSTWGLVLEPHHVLELESLTPGELQGGSAANAAEVDAAAGVGHGASCSAVAGAITEVAANTAASPPTATATAPAAGAAAGVATATDTGTAGTCAKAALPDKFSRHVIVRLPGAALSGYWVAAALVAKMMPAFQDTGLILLKPPDAPGRSPFPFPFVDPAVYSRNRHFRMLWCCKGGKTALLLPSRRYMTAPDPSAGAEGPWGDQHGQSPQGQGQGAQGNGQQGLGARHLPLSPDQIFLASLITNVHRGDRLLELPPEFMNGVHPLRGCPATATLGGAAISGGLRTGGALHESPRSVLIREGSRTRAVRLTWAAEPPELGVNMAPCQMHRQGQGQGLQGQGRQEEEEWGYSDPHQPVAGPEMTAASGPPSMTQWGVTGTTAATGEGDGSRPGPEPAHPRAPAHTGAHVSPGEVRAVFQRLAVAAVPYVETLGTERASGQETKVRSLAYHGEGAIVAYGVQGLGGHYCENLGRCHRSNFVYFLLDLLGGRWCQKCFDPSCQGYRSQWRPLPPRVWQQPLRPASSAAAATGGWPHLPGPTRQGEEAQAEGEWPGLPVLQWLSSDISQGGDQQPSSSPD